ncbi:MAG: hypothetical protein ACI9R3_003488 [Verrucomicrobiales bacterium]|jgi:hypothetical protein
MRGVLVERKRLGFGIFGFRATQMGMNNIDSLDLTTQFPRSPRETFAGYVVAGRMLDKCRAVVAGTNGEYHFDCPLDNTFLSFVEITADAFRNFVATGADDVAVAEWIIANARERSADEIVQWNNDMRDKQISSMPIELQQFLEGYIPQNIPAGKIVRVWFDVYDIEEGRI